MTRLFDDEQSSSLITSMMNPESNATKFMEQGEDIGLPRDVTMDILNKYATYGANTGIGNLGGERLVGYLNEEYRKQVDAPLQEMPKEADLGGFIQVLQNLGTNVVDSVGSVFESAPKAATELSGEAADESLAAIDAAAVPGVEPTASASVTEVIDAVNSPLVDAEGALGKPLPTGLEDAEGNPLLPGPTRLERLQKYLKDNPEVAKGLTDVGKVIGREIGTSLTRGETKKKPSFRAPRPRFQPSQVRTQRIGMAAGGKPEEGSVLGRKLFLGGGEVDGPGGPKEDLVPIWASDREYVVSEKGVRNMGGGDFEKGIAALDKINFGKS